MADRQVRAHSRESISFPRKATVSVQSTAAVNLKKSAPPSSIDSASISENKNPELSAIIHRFVHRDDCVVELGCTDGQNLRLIAEITGDDGCVIGIESSPDHIHRLRNTPALRRIKNLRLYLSRGDSLPIEPDVADVIICQGLVSPSGSRRRGHWQMPPLSQQSRGEAVCERRCHGRRGRRRAAVPATFPDRPPAAIRTVIPTPDR